MVFFDFLRVPQYQNRTTLSLGQGLGTFYEGFDMPLYEYQCCSCEKEFQVLIIKRDRESDTVCPDCGNKTLKRLISRVAYHVSEKARLASFDRNAPRDDSFYKDSRNIGLSAKKMAEQAGVDLGKGFEEKLDKLRSNPGMVLKDYE